MAKKCNASSSFPIGIMYLDNKEYSYERDLEKARCWLEKVANQGCSRAKSKLEKMG